LNQAKTLLKKLENLKAVSQALKESGYRDKNSFRRFLSFQNNKAKNLVVARNFYKPSQELVSHGISQLKELATAIGNKKSRRRRIVVEPYKESKKKLAKRRVVERERVAFVCCKATERAGDILDYFKKTKKVSSLNRAFVCFLGEDQVKPEIDFNALNEFYSDRFDRKRGYGTGSFYRHIVENYIKKTKFAKDDSRTRKHLMEHEASFLKPETLTEK